MKRSISIILALVTALTLASCARNAATQEETGEVGVEEVFDVSVFIHDYADTHIAKIRDALESDLYSAGITATFYDAASDQGKQTQQVKEAIAQDTDMLVVNIVTPYPDDAPMNIVELAKEADIPVVFFDREVSNDVVSSYDKCVHVGTDPTSSGVGMGELLTEILQDKTDEYDLNGDGDLSYILFFAEPGCPEATIRSLPALDMLKDRFGDILVYYDPDNPEKCQYCNWAAAEAQDAMAAALETNPFDGSSPVELAIACNDDMALGAIEALNEAGWNKGDGGDRIPVVGVDGTDAAKEAINAGKMDGTVMFDAQGTAHTIFALCRNTANGEELMANTSDYSIDEDCAKIRVPYVSYTGE